VGKLGGGKKHGQRIGELSSKPNSQRIGELTSKPSSQRIAKLSSKPSSQHIGELTFKPRPVPVPAAAAQHGGVPEYMLDESYYREKDNDKHTNHGGKKSVQKIFTSVFRRGGANTPSGTGDFAGSSSFPTAQQLSGQPVPLDDAAYRVNAGLDTSANDASALTTSTEVNTSAEDTAEDVPTFTAVFPTSTNHDAATGKDSSFDRAVSKGQTMATLSSHHAPKSNTVPSASASRDPFAAMPTFEPDFDSVLGAFSAPSISRTPAKTPSTPAYQALPAQRQAQPVSVPGNAADIDAANLHQPRESPRPRPRAQMMQPVRQDNNKNNPSNSALHRNPFDEVKEQSTARDARRERLARERLAAARSSSCRGRSPSRRARRAPIDPPSSSEVNRRNSGHDNALNTSDEILNSAADDFFAPPEPSPEEMAEQFYVRSRSVSPRRARSHVKAPSSPRTSTARSQSQGRPAGGSSISGSTASGIGSSRGRSRVSSRSRPNSRHQSHRLKSRDGRDSASVVSAMSVDEESRFLDILAKHFPAESQTRDQYQPSGKSSEYARMRNDLHRIREGRVHGAALMQTQSSTPASASTHLPRPAKSVTTSGSGYGASLEAAARVLSVDNHSHYAYDASVEAYTYGLGRGERAIHRRSRSTSSLEVEEDEFSAFGAIMSSDGSMPARTRNETPRKPMAGKSHGRSPAGVAEFGQYY